MQEIIVRMATEADFAQLSELFHEFNFSFNLEITSGQTKELLKVADEQKYTQESTRWILDDLICFVAESDGHLLGYISGRVKNNEGEVYGPEGEIDTWFVTVAERGKGIGQKLYEAMIKYFAEQNCKVLSLEAYCQNTAAISTYEQLGFHKDSITLKKII